MVAAYVTLLAAIGAGSLTALAAGDAAGGPLPQAASGARSGGAEASARRVAPWSWPLTPRPRIVHVFRPPPTPYAAGHRGVDLAPTGSDLTVRAVDDGLVTHAGVLAGRGTVTVTHANQMRSTYEPVTSTLRAGQPVGRGGVVGHLDSARGHCLPATCLHLGALRQGSAGLWEYTNPLFLLRDIEIVLLPMSR